MVEECVQEIKADLTVISVLNQVRIHKKMILLCELVEFFRRRKTREAREEKDARCLNWKCKFNEPINLSKKSCDQQKKFVEQLVNKEIKTVVDFECDVETKHEVSSNGVHAKKKG